MQMAGSMTICSSSPPVSVWSQCAAHSNPSTTNESDNPTWTQPIAQGSRPRPVRGGLSCLFANTNAKYASPSANDLLETSCFPSSGIVPNTSQNDLSSLREASESRCVGIKISASSLGMSRERSPISVLQGPLSHGSSNHNNYMTSFVAKESITNCHLPLDLHSVKAWKMPSPLLVPWSSLLAHENIDGIQIVRYTKASTEMLMNDSASIEYEENHKSDAFAVLCEQIDMEECDDSMLKETATGAFVFPDEQSDTKEWDESILEIDFPDKQVANGIGSEKVLSSRDMYRFSENLTVIDTPLEISEACSKLKVILPTEELLIKAQALHRSFLDELVIKAFKLAAVAHKHQFRFNGDPYVVHCVETALLLSEAGAGTAVIAAGLLHDIIDDTEVDEEQLRAIVGTDVSNLVVGVSKLSQFSQLARDRNIAHNVSEAERLHNMFLTMVDVRVVLIKLADRLHNLRTLEALPDVKQQRVAIETLEIMTPMASRLGLSCWKSEMEDICFRYLQPDEYNDILGKLAFSGSQEVVNSAVKQLDQALQAKDVGFHDLRGRSKNLFSIYTKMIKKGQSINEIYDVHGLRVVVANEQNCYDALEVVHHLWPHVPGKIKDYIVNPKANGYQSLHTVVWVEGCFPLEIQIRTLDMHCHAEFGMAAHWRYKESNDKYSSFIIQRVEWARWILTWHSEIFESKLQISPMEASLKHHCPFPFHNNDCPYASLSCRPPSSDKDPLFVIILEDDRMVVREFPAGSTVGDLLMYREKSSKSFVTENQSARVPEMQPKVNHQFIKNSQQKLLMGDLVELTAINSSCCQQMFGIDTELGGKVRDEERMISAYRDQIRRMYEEGRRLKVEEMDFQPVTVKTAEIAGLL